MEEIYLECSLGEGMFSNEKSFSFRNYSGEDVEGFYPTSLIHENKLKVTLLKEENKLALICLHQSPVIGNEMQIISREQITKII